MSENQVRHSNSVQKNSWFSRINCTINVLHRMLNMLHHCGIS